MDKAGVFSRHGQQFLEDLPTSSRGRVSVKGSSGTGEQLDDQGEGFPSGYACGCVLSVSSFTGRGQAAARAESGEGPADGLLWRRGQAAQALTLTLRFAGGTTWEKTRRLPEPSAHDEDVRTMAYQLMDAAGLQRARLTGIALKGEDLIDADQVTQ